MRTISEEEKIMLENQLNLMNYGVFEIRQRLSKLEGWWLVLLAILLVLGAVLVVSMAIWCVSNGHGSFTGAYSWKDLWTLKIECKW